MLHACTHPLDKGDFIYYVFVDSCSAMASVDLQEKANFTRLSRLLVDRGTEALRNTFDGIHPPASLPAVLKVNKSSLLKLKPRVITNSQWDVLYPPSGNPPDSKTFDVTLLTVLFRNICGTFPKTGWGVTPVDTDRSMQANIVRIKSYRNEVYAHVTSTRVDNATFESLWQKITQALVELNIPQNDVDDLKICPLTSEEETYIGILKDWKLREEEYIAVEEEVLKKLEGIGYSINRLTEITEDGIKRLSTFQKRSKKEALESPLRRLPKTTEDYCIQDDENDLRKLAKFPFMNKIRRKVKLFLPETRKWLLKKVDDWFLGEEHESRIFLLNAGPGFGKSVFAAKVCEDFKKKRKLAACHFCDFSDSNLRNPKLMLQSLASQMCENVMGFREKLLDQLKRPHEIRSLKDAFGIYLQNPLDELQIEEQEPFLIVIDGLDESAADHRNDIVSLIANYFPDLPEYIKVLVTSRPEISLAKLSSVPEINIESNNPDNDSDLAMYLKHYLPSIAEKNQDCDAGMLEKLVAMCEGSFLYAFHVQCELQKRDNLNNMTLPEIINIVPKSLDSVYQSYFQRLENELKEVLRKNIDVMILLELFVAARGPLPLTFISRALGLAPDCRETKIVIKKINEAVSCLLYVSDDMVTLFHKSVIDWLLAKGYQDHEYSVKISDGDKSLWQICEKVFEEIDARKELAFTNDVIYALSYGFVHLVACDMKECFSWLVNVEVIYVLLSFSCDELSIVKSLLILWKDVLRFDEDISDELRARISWHIVEIELNVVATWGAHTHWPGEPGIKFPSFYLESILTHSPKGYFSEDEKHFAKSLLTSTSMFVKITDDEVEVIPRAIWCLPSMKSIQAVGVSSDKTRAAVAQRNGTISVVSLPSLVELWQYSSKHRVSCCTFAPDGSFVLFGKLEAALSIVEENVVPFFHGNQETFNSCAFSPNGKRLVTSNGLEIIKLWDVDKQSLLSLLSAKVPVNWCSFNSTGLYIIGNRKCSAKSSIVYFCRDGLEDSDLEDSDLEDLDFEDEYNHDFEDEYGHDFEDEDSDAEDSFCVWNAITAQRSDVRTLPERKLTNRKAFHSKLCKLCFRPGCQRPSTYKLLDVEPYESLKSTQVPYLTWSTGVYNGVECIFALGEQSVSVIENIHFTTLAAWNFTVDGYYNTVMKNSYYKWKIFREITAIEDDLWLYADVKKLIVFRTSESACPKRVTWSSFSPDGSRLATCTSDGCIDIWNAHTSEVKQHFKQGEGKLPFACWWSQKFFFVFDFVDKIPQLSKYPVDINLTIMFSQSQQVALCHLVDEFISLSSVIDFSEGFLCLECGDSRAVKIIDVNAAGGPQVVTLPEIEPKMSIKVSPGASFVLGDKECRERKPLKVLDMHQGRIVTESPPMEYGLTELVPGARFIGGNKNKYYIWKRKAKKAAMYELFHTQPGIPLSNNCGVISCFSSDAKAVVFAYKLFGHSRMHCEIIDLITGNHKNVVLDYVDLNSKLFCINNVRVVVAVAHQHITFLDMDSGRLLGCSFQRYYGSNLFTQTKFTPSGSVLAFPKITGNIKFLPLFIPPNPLLSEIKEKACTASKFGEMEDMLWSLWGDSTRRSMISATSLIESMWKQYRD